MLQFKSEQRFNRLAAITLPQQFSKTMLEPTKYKASLDNLAKLVTAAVTIFFAVIIVGQFSLIRDEGKAIPIYTTTAVTLIYFSIFFFRPLGYLISKDKIIICRPFDTVEIDKSGIKTVELIDSSKLRWSIRIFGVGGLFGYFGRFTNIKLGRMTWYATRRDKPVLIVTLNGTKIIVTPDEADKFVSDFNQS